MNFTYTSCVFLLSLFGASQAGFLHGGLVTTSYGVGIGGGSSNGGSGQGQGQSQGQSQGPQTDFGGGLVNTASYGQLGPIATSSSYRQQITNSVPAVTTYTGVATGTAYPQIPQYINGNGARSGLQGGHAVVNTNNGFGGYGHY